MARSKPFRRIEVDEQICLKIDRKYEEKRRKGSFTSFVEEILDLYGDGLLTDSRDTSIVHATRVKKVGEHEHRKTA